MRKWQDVGRREGHFLSLETLWRVGQPYKPAFSISVTFPSTLLKSVVQWIGYFSTSLTYRALKQDAYARTIADSITSDPRAS